MTNLNRMQSLRWRPPARVLCRYAVKLAEGMRDAFRKPLGKLVPDADVSCAALLEIARDSVLIAVGDATTWRLLQCGIVPHVQVVDGIEKRARRTLPDSTSVRALLRCSNPAGSITEEAESAVRRALDLPGPVRVLVDGEEDLLVLPVCVHAPEGATVLYGQPGSGLVVVRITAETRNKARELIGMMGGA